MNWTLTVESGKYHDKYCIISVVQKPGNLATHVYEMQATLVKLFLKLILYHSKLGAYTEPFAGPSSEVMRRRVYVISWRRIKLLKLKEGYL